MKKIVCIILCIIVYLCFMGQGVYSEDTASSANQSYDKNGISFSYPSTCRIEDNNSPGQYSIVHCSSPEGNFFSLTVFQEKADPELVLNTYKGEFEKQFKEKGATDTTFSDIEGDFFSKKTKGWLMAFKLNNIDFENRTYSLNINDKPICFTIQYPVMTKESAEKFFQLIISTLSLK